MIAGYSSYIIAIGGDVLPAFRFWVPLVPVGSVLVGLGVVALGRTVGSRLGTGATPVTTAAIAVLLVGLSGFGVERHWDRFQNDRKINQDHVDTMRDIGLWLKDRLDPHEAIATTPIGAVSYFSERPVIDMLGLTDWEVAHRPMFVPGLEDTWKEKKYNAPSVLRRRPTVILFSTGIRPSATAEKALFLYDDFHRSYYALNFRVDPTRPGTETLYRLRPQAPPPPEEYVPHPSVGFVDDYAGGIFYQIPAHLDLERSGRLLERAAREAPASFSGALEWWACYLDDQKHPRALGLLDKVVSDDPLALKATRRLAYHRLVAGEFEGAEELLLAYRHANPDSPVAWEGLAQIARHREDYDAARQLTERALSLWTTNVTALVTLGNLNLVTDRRPEARRAYEDALRLQPGIEAAERGLAILRQREGSR